MYSQKYSVLEIEDYFYFHDNFDESGPIFIIFFTVKFRKDLWRKLELKLSPPLKSVAALPCKKKVFTIQHTAQWCKHV